METEPSLNLSVGTGWYLTGKQQYEQIKCN